MEQSKAVHLSQLVEHQTGSVVSRTLLERPTGTVTLFAFDADQALSEHTAPFDALVHVLEGEVEVTVAGDPHRLGEGQALIMPAHVPHALKALRPLKFVLTMIREPSSRP